MRKKIILFFASLLVIALAMPLSVSAFDVKSGSSVYVAEAEVIDGNLYIGASNIVIDGAVSGDLFCGASSVTINGTINGDVFCAASSILINGTVGGSVRSVSSELSVNGNVERSLLSVGSSINISPQAKVGWNILAAAATLNANGEVGGDIQFAGANLTVNNTVGGEVDFYAENHSKKSIKQGPSIDILPKANISGNVSYPDNVQTNISEQATVNGSLIKKVDKVSKQWSNGPWLAAGFGSYLLFKFIIILSVLIIGAVLVILFQKKTKAITDLIIKESGATIGWGVVVFFVTPFVIFLLILTVIGIPLALIILVIYLLLICFSKIIAAITVGRWLGHKFGVKSLYWAMVVGIVVSYIVFAIPLIGWLAALAALWWGLGGIVKYCNAERK